MDETPPTGNVVTPPDETEDVVATAMRNLKAAQTHSGDWRTEARVLFDLVAGKQWSDEDAALIREKYQNSYPMVTFNVAGKYLDAVTGLQINNRQEVRFMPRNPGGTGIDEYATGVYKWNRDQCNADDEESDAFRDLALTGMGWVEHFYDDSEDAEGWIGQERRDGLEMFWDPRARRNNLADRQWQIRVKPMSPDDYRLDAGEEPPGFEDGALGEQSSPQVITLPHDYGTSTGGSNMPKMVYVIDFQFWKLEDAVHVTADFGKGSEKKTLPPDKWQALKPEMVQAGVQHTEETVKVKRYYRAWIAGNKLIKGGVKLLKCEGFTFEAITGKRDRNTNTWYGLGRAMLDPNRWVNKFFSSILYTLMTNAKGGLVAEEGVFEDDRKAEQSWANPASITKVTAGAVAGNRMMPKPQAAYPQGMDRLMTFSLDALPLTTGLNPEILGLANREQAGVLESQRKQAALAIISWAFDAMRRYHKRSGKLMLSMIRCYLNSGQLIRIGPKGAEQYVPMMKDKLVAQYDIVIDEAPTSVNMQERTWSFLKEIIPMAEKMGVPIPPGVLEFAPIPTQLQNDWMKLLQPDPAAQALQNRRKEAEVALMESDIAKNNAQAQEAISRPKLAALEHQITMMSEATAAHGDQLNAAYDNHTKQLVAEIQRDSAETVAIINALTKVVSDQKAAADAKAQADAEAAAAAPPDDTEEKLAMLVSTFDKLSGAIEAARAPKDMIYDEMGNLVRIQ